MVELVGNPQSSRRREVSSKLRRAPSWRAAARMTRRRRAGSRERRRSISMATAEWPGEVLTERPPPRTGLPGRRSWGRTRLSSACQRSSSSRASSARLARVRSRLGLNSRSWGRSSWRMRLRVKAVSVLVESSRQGWWSWLRKDSRSARRVLRRGGESCPNGQRESGLDWRGRGRLGGWR